MRVRFVQTSRENAGRSLLASSLAMSLLKLIVLALSLTSTLCVSIAEPKTKIKFNDKKGSGKLKRLGVRTKGPIKVYAVGEYSSGDYVLKMSYGVGAAKMSGALVDALKPRCSDAKSIAEFEACLVGGLPNGATKGTELVFSTGGFKLGVAVNGKKVGSVGGPSLCKAFAKIYTDKKAVCAMHEV